MPVSMTRRNLARVVVLVLCGVGVLVSCAKEPLRVDRNRPPTTYLVAAPAESAGSSYRVHLYWRGEDPDGYVAGFLWAWDDTSISAFHFTTRTDSTFDLEVNDSLALLGSGNTQPTQSKYHTFYIRAVDNLGKADPSLARFNRRLFLASTSEPVVRFVGAIPSGTTSSGVDTLCDGRPFKICWTGSDADGYVKYYRWDVGIFSSGFSADTCAYFNDPSVPGSVSLINGLYTFTVTAVDNAFSRSNPSVGGRTLFVVNHDPETRIYDATPPANAPNPEVAGYYFAPYLDGVPAPPEGDLGTRFFEGDTIPYRSTVYFTWKGFDDACDIPNNITAFSAALRGTHSPAASSTGGDPYITGFRNVLCIPAAGDTVFFTTNKPSVLGRCGGAYQSLVLDSLDAGFNILFNVAARDGSGRGDSSPASFRFSCNRKPTVSNLTADSIAATPTTPAQMVFTWVGKDPEDGLTGGIRATFDDGSPQVFTASPGTALQSKTLPKSFFYNLNPGANVPHRFSVRVIDRAGYLSDDEATVSFYLDGPPPGAAIPPTTSSETTAARNQR